MIIRKLHVLKLGAVATVLATHGGGSPLSADLLAHHNPEDPIREFFFRRHSCLPSACLNRLAMAVLFWLAATSLLATEAGEISPA